MTIPSRADLRGQIARVLFDHQPPMHLDRSDIPHDEFDCCADAIMELLAPTLDGLEADSKRLRALYGAGVDNWDGYDYAMGLLREEC